MSRSLRASDLSQICRTIRPPLLRPSAVVALVSTFTVGGILRLWIGFARSEFLLAALVEITGAKPRYFGKVDLACVSVLRHVEAPYLAASSARPASMKASICLVMLRFCRSATASNARRLGPSR